MITETDEVAEALKVAAARWPGEPPTELLKHLLAEGTNVLRNSREAERAAIRESAGALAGVYQVGYLKELRQDWPE